VAAPLLNEDAPTVGRALELAAARWPDREAFACDGIRLSYRDLAEATRRTGAALLARGVGKGDRVAICMGNSAAWLTLFCANALIGAATVPLDPRLAPAELKARLQRSDSVLLGAVDRVDDQIDVVATLRAIEPALDRALPGAELPRLGTVVVLGFDVPRGATSYGAFQGQAGTGVTVDRATVARAAAAVGPDDALLAECGPERATRSHAEMLRNAAAAAERVRVKPGDRCFDPRPFAAPADIARAILAPLCAGACAVSMPRFAADEALRILECERCTLMAGDDAAIRAVTGHPSFDPARLWLRDSWGGPTRQSDDATDASSGA
jgi:fatty-acyl-CoA synthase